MSKKKKLLMVLLVLAVFLSVALGVRWHLRHYVIVELQLYPKDAQRLDLREQDISIRHYKKLHSRLPECEIWWNIPFQGKTISWDAEEISVSSLTEQDIQDLEYFTCLQTVNAEDCTDYENLLKLRQSRPDLKVSYSVRLGSERYSADEQKIVLGKITGEEIPLLAYLPNLKQVWCKGSEPEVFTPLKEYCQAHQLEFAISLGGKEVPLTAKTVNVAAVTDEEVELLRFLPELKTLHISQPEASAQKLAELKQSRPDVTVTWDRKVGGQVFSSTAEEIDLSTAQITSLETLSQEMAYFPEAKLVFLGECGLDNELLAAHREQARDQYKLVWTVSFGDKTKCRTDETTFMPVREHIYYFNDEEAYNLRYCEDMVCIDIGHMSIHNIDFVEYMPNLEYLILAHTQLQYIDPISSCKKLKFLELDWAPLRDLTPLKGCTALEDLNLGKVYADFTPIGEMTWLKNLWMVECSSAARSQMTQALPNTKVMITGAATVANGWRDLDNYYEMRDLLGMHYMSW